jgi:hypothetical protein
LASTHPASNPKRFALCGSARIANASTLYPWPKGTGFYGYSDNKRKTFADGFWPYCNFFVSIIQKVMSINYPVFFAQSVIPGGAVSGSPIDNIVGVFTKKPNVDPNSISGALNDLWNVAMDGTLYQIIYRLGLLIAVLAVGFWCHSR